MLGAASTITRPKNETAEEKKARKQAIKRERQVLCFSISHHPVMLMVSSGSKKGEEGYQKFVFSGKKAAKQGTVYTGKGRSSQAMINCPVVHSQRMKFRFLGHLRN